MATPPWPPGPPPQHHRAPGTPRHHQAGPVLGGGFGPARTPLTPQPAVGPGAAVAIGLGTLLLGLFFGFVLGRATSDEDVSSPPLTSPSTLPPRTGATLAPSPQTTPSTDLEPGGVGTMESPVPAGQGYVLGSYTLTVLAADRDAAPELRAHEPSNIPPPAGATHVVVQVRITFDEDGGFDPTVTPFALSDGEATFDRFESTCGEVPDDLAELGLQTGGGEIEGNLCFTVPDDVAPAAMLTTQGFAGPLYFALPPG